MAIERITFDTLQYYVKERNKLTKLKRLPSDNLQKHQIIYQEEDKLEGKIQNDIQEYRKTTFIQNVKPNSTIITNLEKPRIKKLFFFPPKLL